MTDFLKVAKQAAVESVTVAGVKITVRGLNVRDLQAITNKRGKDNEGILLDLICSCCFYANGSGKPIIPEDRKGEVGELSPAAFRALSDAVAKVNGFAPGNSGATATEDSSTD